MNGRDCMANQTPHPLPEGIPASDSVSERGEFIHAHEDLVDKVNQDMPDEEILYDLAELFKIFGDSTRIKILYVLFESEMCVYDIAQLLHMTQSAISHQLRALKQSKLVKYRREGKTVFYSLDDEHIRMVLEQGMTHLRHKRGYHE